MVASVYGEPHQLPLNEGGLVQWPLLYIITHIKTRLIGGWGAAQLRSLFDQAKQRLRRLKVFDFCTSCGYLLNL